MAVVLPNGPCPQPGRFVVVYPEGIPSPHLKRAHTWNGGYCCGPAQTEGVDDVAFVAAVIDVVTAAHPVDPARVFAVGHSNGGIMAYRLACELSDRVAAIGVVAGSLGVDRCSPDRPVSLLHVHGTADQNHPIEGGSGTNSLAGVEFHPPIDAVRAIAAVDGCPEQSSTSSEGDLTTQRWSPCDEGTEVALVIVEGA